MKKNDILTVRHDDGLPVLEITKVKAIKVRVDGQIFFEVQHNKQSVVVSLSQGENAYKTLYKLLGDSLL